MENFSLDDDEMDEETVCYIAADWARTKIHQIYGEANNNQKLKSDENGCAQMRQRLTESKHEAEMNSEVSKKQTSREAKHEA